MNFTFLDPQLWSNTSRKGEVYEICCNRYWFQHHPPNDLWPCGWAAKSFNEEEIKKYKRAKADPIIAPEKGQVLWEVSVEGPSTAPFIGRKYQHDEVFCYISTPWGEYEKIMANFTGRVVEVCAAQGAVVNKGDVIAYLERTEFFAWFII